MRIAILGAGGIGLGYAAMLQQAGHRPVVWSPTGKSVEAHADGEVTVSGNIEGSFRFEFADSPEAVTRDAEVVVLAVPGYGHRAVIEQILPFARDGQTFIVSAQLSFSAVYLADQLESRGVNADVVAWATTVLMGRRTGPSAIAIGGIRDVLELAALPASSTERCLALCTTLFGDRFRAVDSVVAIALSNLNPPIHMASALCNLTRIEKGEYWANYDGITPAVARLIEALDLERLALAAELGVTVRTVEQHYRLTFAIPEGLSVAEMAAIVHERRKGPPGPTSLDTRFVTEDVPFGIVPLLALANERRMDLPLHRAGIAMFSALYGRDFAKENDLLASLNLKRLAS
jgi:opine dehydrogenase